MKEYKVKVYKVAGEAEVKIAAETADEAAKLALDKARELKFEESSRKFEAEALAIVVE